MSNGVQAWLDWDTERLMFRGRTTRVVVEGELGSLDRRVAEWVLADTLGILESDVIVTRVDLSVVLPSRLIAESETYRALIDEAVARSCVISRQARGPAA